ncbi:hypothetical protein [Streptococcus suis]|uniref:hypothetical protein n=1 Tax=Streptococcus suis TaxID=1307 RepID=UPI000945475F|nr:hypothetical protein [Streptococcus suis]WNN04324.1 hypothetical protein RMQ63_04140 [Streptococcus suis]WNN10718.1 hypothetical protein RMQ62_07365 [Streptococcus suis]WNO80347.1 hypothetical protein RMP65_08770 [Streptococcus suis]HEL2000946.1 hypothetical protein [Streptococcus suis]HEL2419682.1 hypothetical protein [Streptococcus suis]
MVKIKKNTDELEEYWNDQISYLKRAIDYFDEGNETEARRIASSLRILLHHTKSSQALIKQLNRNVIYLSSSFLYTPSNLLSTWTLLVLEIKDNQLTYKPNLDFYGKGERLFYLTFEDWWNEIIFDDKQNVFTRKDIILFVANNDGGAHVDPELKESFALLTKCNSLGVTNNYGDSPLSNPIYQAVRVIAEEFLLSVAISFSGLKNRRQYKERKFEMRFVDNMRRYKWSTTDISCSSETMEIVNRHKSEARRLYRQEFGNGMAVEYIGK